MSEKPSRRHKSKSAGETTDSTRDKILDAAELLFGERSFDTVSLRDITQRAGVTLALASYHFGTKDNLYSQVVGRRASVLGEMRRARLSQLETSAGLTTEGILDAFMHPLFEKMQSGSSGWQAYIMVISGLAQTNRWLDLLHENFDATADIFLDALSRTLPDLPRHTLMRGFSLSLVAMLQTVAKNRRVDALSGGAVSADDLDAAYATLLKFTARGMEALAELK